MTTLASGGGGGVGVLDIPPDISNLRLSQSSVDFMEGVGTITIQVQLNYLSGFGLVSIRVEISDGTSLTVPIPDPPTAVSGTIIGAATFSTSMVGAFQAEVWVVNQRGNESNRLTTPFTVEPVIWASTSTTGAPTGRWDHTAIWTGTEMIVWGGRTHGGAMEFLAAVDD